MRVMIAGDVHGEFNAFSWWLEEAKKRYAIEAAIQVGDFGFFRQDIDKAIKTGRRFPVPVYVIDGNHEDHAWLAQGYRRGDSEQWRTAMNLIYQPRATVAELGGQVIGFLGGALHIDRPQQHNLLNGISNYVGSRELEAAKNLFNCRRPDLIVTHSCPAGIGIGMIGDPLLGSELWKHVVDIGYDPGPDNDRGEMTLRELWLKLEYRPKLWAFGHFHEFRKVVLDGTCFYCAGIMGGIGDRNSPHLIWDTESGTVQSFTLGLD